MASRACFKSICDENKYITTYHPVEANKCAYREIEHKSEGFVVIKTCKVTRFDGLAVASHFREHVALGLYLFELGQHIIRHADTLLPPHGKNSFDRHTLQVHLQ